MPTATASSFPPSIFLPPFLPPLLFPAPFLPSSCPPPCPIFSVDQSSAFAEQRETEDPRFLSNFFPSSLVRFRVSPTTLTDGCRYARDHPPSFSSPSVHLLLTLFTRLQNFRPLPPPLLSTSSATNDPFLPIPVFFNRNHRSSTPTTSSKTRYFRNIYPRTVTKRLLR